MFSFVRTTLLLLLMVGGLPSHASAENTTESSTQNTTTLVLFGDSIIAGYGLPESDSLSVQLESYLTDNKHKSNHKPLHKPNIKVINAGVSGDTTSSGLNRLSWTLKRTSPDIVFLALGGNDVLRGLAPAITRKNLDAMLKILQEKNVQVLFSRVPAPTNLGEEYMKELNAAYEELATLYDVPLYPFLLQDIFTTPELMLPDGIHPSAAGIKAITPPLGDSILKFLSNSTSR